MAPSRRINKLTADNRKDPLTPRDFAIYRHVWTLIKHEQQKLDRYFLLRGSAKQLIKAVDKYYEKYPTAFRDTIEHDTFHIELEYLHTSLMKLEEAVETRNRNPLLMISVRINFVSAFCVGLVKEVDPKTFDERQYLAIQEIQVSEN